jgi:formylglycine-generating enzyme required for sulfatase activity
MVSRADLLLLLSRRWSDAGGDSSVVSGESELLAQQLQLGIGPAVLVPSGPDFSSGQLPNPEQEQQREQQTALELRRLLKITAVESAASEAPDAPVYWKWTSPPPAAPKPRLLAQWPELWERLRRLPGFQDPRGPVDVQRLTDQVAARRPLEPVPRHPQVRGLRPLYVVMDVSHRLMSFVDDYFSVREGLIRDFPGLAPVFLDGADPRSLRVINREGIPIRGVSATIPSGSHTLVLGDIGFLAFDPNIRTLWVEWARELRRRDCECSLLFPGAPGHLRQLPPGLFQTLAWCRGRVGNQMATRHEQVTRLLQGVAPEKVVRPELLREIRELLGIQDPAAEAWFLQDARVVRHALYAKLKDFVKEQYREDFDQNFDSDTRRKILAAIRAQRYVVSETPELWFDVILGLSPESRQLLPEQDLRDAEAMLRELEKAIDREGNWQAPAIREWLQRMLFGFSNVAYAGDSDTAKRLRKLHRELLPESGSAPETPPGERPVESSRGMIRLQADKPNCLTLEWLPDGIPKDASVQYPVLGFIKATNRFVAINVEGERQTRTQVAQIELPTRPGKRDFPWRPGQSLRVSSACESAVLDWSPGPAWASSAGTDQFGQWAECTIGEAKYRWRWIPPGRFWMGSPEDELGRYVDEGPRHRVTITKGFWMGDTPVTQEFWRAVVLAGGQSTNLKADPSRFAERNNHPVDSVNWNQCVAFSELVTTLLGNGIRVQLPTEAEWEYACRAGTETAFNNGEPCTHPEGRDPGLDSVGWYGENSGGRTRPVSQKLPNRWGLCDMHGNVWEWCRDSVRGYATEEWVDPFGVGATGADRVLRGGGWNFWAWNCRSAFRNAFAPGFAWDAFGLRLSAGQDEPGPAAAGG